jgi:replication-associated recombination protein RarA
MAEEEGGRPRARERFGDQLTPTGHRCDEVTSALQKTIRRGLEREALFWAMELVGAGFTNYVWRRLRLIASEDVGLGEPMVPVLIRCLFENWREQKAADRGSERNANLFLTHAVIALARAPKSRLVDHAYVVASSPDRPRLEVPDYALDMHTKAGRKLGRGARHFYEHGAIVEPRAPVADSYREEAVRVDEAEERRRQAARHQQLKLG